MSITKISPDVVDFDAGITITTADNTSNLILTSTDADANVGPVLELYRNSSTPADNDEIGRIYFYGENDNDEKMEYGLIRGTIVDASDGTEDSALQIYTYSGGGQRNRIDLLAGETVFNEGSQDLDFRVESDNSANALFVEGDTGRVMLGSNDPGTKAHANADNLVIYEAANAGLTIATGSSNYGSIFFGDGTSGSEPYTGYIQYGHDSASTGYQDVMTIGTGATQRIGVGVYGITFGSGQHTSARGLDDYEEGTYTPTMFGVTTAGSVAYSSQAGWYTKVGRIVVAYFDINVSSASGMAGTTAITIPVQSGNFNAYMGVTYWDLDDNYFDAGKGATGYVYPNTTRIELYQTTDGAKGHDVGNTFKANQTGRISGSVTYFSAT